MSIRPIDPLIMNNTPHAEKIASIKTTQDENEQAQSAMAVQKKFEEEPNQVAALNESVAQNKISREPQKDKERKNQQQKKNQKKNEEEGSIIDIRI